MLHIRIDNKLKADAAVKLVNLGLSVSGDVRIILIFVRRTTHAGDRRSANLYRYKAS
ncbi:type II toxin-antitoxin system RelB/DinJ family antitoxin [Pantoea agglomerans]